MNKNKGNFNNTNGIQTRTCTSLEFLGRFIPSESWVT